jgi:hypothetical protein
VASGAAAPAKSKAARATEVGEDSRVGWSGRVGQMPLGPARRENKKKRWAARTSGPKWFLAALRKRKKSFQILIQGIIFKFKF